MKKFRLWLTLFWTFFKIGLFTFGGGYAMIPLIQAEISERKKWMAPEEILDIVVIAESTPGPISVNAATYVGYRVGGVLGAVFATLGLAIPSLVIIYVISLFLNQFMSIQIVANAFLGIEAAIAVLITSAAIKLKKSIPNDGFNVTIILLIVLTLLVINIFNWNFSSIYLIIIGGIVGIVFDLLARKTKKETKI
ncbi:MAG: chromate transporter [Firmicutes bacterium]|nr:chromate transporter [Bacillota bacterium]